MKLKTCIIQPLYSADYADSDRLYRWELDALDRCDDSLDLIVLPEACDVPAFAKTKADFLASYHKYNEGILTKAAETAKRCHAMLFVNAVCKVGEAGDGTELLRNTTYAFNRKGEIVGDVYLSDLEDQGKSLMDYIKQTYHYKVDRVLRTLDKLSGEEESG